MRHFGNAAGESSAPKRDRRLHDPFRQVPFVHFIKSSTLWNNWTSILFFIIEACIITFLSHPKRPLSVSTTILTVLGTLIGFTISYRTSSAYTQYNEARKAWGNVIHHSRTLSRMIWLHVPNELFSHPSNDPPNDEEKVRALIEKKTMINLTRAFSVSLKHYSRGEYGIFYEDLYHLTCLLPKYNQTGATFFSNVSRFPSHVGSPNLSFAVELEKPYSTLTRDIRASEASTIHAANPTNPEFKLLPAYNPPAQDQYDYLPFLAIFRMLFKGALNASGRRKASDRRYCPEENLPLEILWHLSIYISTLQARKVVDVPTINIYNAALVGLSDALSNVERVLTTPIPFGYHVHLKTIIWVYLAFLPFQLIATFKQITIPATGFIAFAFLGFLEVGQDIENPFGYGQNDLDLDHFCDDLIGRELTELTSSILSDDPMSYVFMPSNVPLFERGLFQSGSEISTSLLPHELERRLFETSKSDRKAV